MPPERAVTEVKSLVLDATGIGDPGTSRLKEALVTWTIQEYFET
ncbi:MAG TPA: hypothetical protein VIP11_12750 [Gemmatimonadaceae bacterium]